MSPSSLDPAVEALPKVIPSLKKLNPSPSFVDDALQEFRTNLLTGNDARLASYSGSGSLAAWLRVSATRAGLDALRRAKRRKESPQPELALLAGSDAGPEVELFRASYGQAFRGALKDALERLDAQQRNVLRLHFSEGLNIEAIGKAYGVHRATVARWIVRARGQILSDVRERLIAPGSGLCASEFDCLARLIRSEVARGVSGLLSTHGAVGGGARLA